MPEESGLRESILGVAWKAERDEPVQDKESEGHLWLTKECRVLSEVAALRINL